MAARTWTLTDSYGNHAGMLVEDPELGVWVQYPDDTTPPTRFASVEEAETTMAPFGVTATAD